MGELSGVTIIFRGYYTKYHLRLDSIIGQDLLWFVLIHHAASSDWMAGCFFTGIVRRDKVDPGRSLGNTRDLFFFTGGDDYFDIIWG